jgi:multicomponent Na+:H+ antiporter subunit F
MIGGSVVAAMLGILAVAAFLAVFRLARGPSLADRVVAVDLIASVGVAVCGVTAIAFDLAVFLDVAMMLALISFVGTVAFARYLEWRSR